MIAQAYHGAIDLLLTGMIMPCMGGLALAEQLATLRPDIAVVFMSGYMDAVTIHVRSFVGKAAEMYKPFSPIQVARTVRAMLDAASPHHRAQTIR